LPHPKNIYLVVGLELKSFAPQECTEDKLMATPLTHISVLL